MDNQHAKLSASGSDQWLNCPGSIKACEGLENISSKFAEEGTIAHEKAANHLINNTDTTDFDDIPIQNYLEYVRGILSEIENPLLFVEKRVDFSDYVHEGFGTTDVAIVDSNTKTCHIIDLKYGKGVAVYADENNQMRIYALGMLKEYPDLEHFHLHIVQPRIGNYSKIYVTLAELLMYAEWVNHRSKIALSSDAPRVPGNKQCRWCLAKNDCKELLSHSQAIISAEFSTIHQPVMPEVKSLSNKQLTLIMNNRELIREFLISVEDRVFQEVQKGNDSLGYKLVTKRGNRTWSETAEQELVAKLGDEAYSKKLIGLGSAEKLLGKAIVSELTDPGKESIALVEDSDKRTAIVTFD